MTNDDADDARRERPKSGARKRATGQTSQGGAAVDDPALRSGSTAGPLPGTSSPAPEARETAPRPALSGPPWSERSYERGFVIGAITGCYILVDRPGVSPEDAQLAASVLSQELLGWPEHEQGGAVARLTTAFVEAQRGIVGRHVNHGRKGVR